MGVLECGCEARFGVGEESFERVARECHLVVWSGLSGVLEAGLVVGGLWLELAARAGF